MTEQCSHDTTTKRQGDTWVDCNGYPHTVIYVTCSSCRKTVRVRQTGQDVPFTPAAQMWPVGGKP